MGIGAFPLRAQIPADLVGEEAGSGNGCVPTSSAYSHLPCGNRRGMGTGTFPLRAHIPTRPVGMKVGSGDGCVPQPFS